MPELIYYGGAKILALRCILCGDIINRVIVQNRQRRRHPLPSRARTPIYGSDRWKKNKPALA
jgi:hypothetical protein